MEQRVYAVSTKIKGRRWEVLHFDKPTSCATLLGVITGSEGKEVEFKIEPFNKSIMDKAGYKIVVATEGDIDAVQSGIQEGLPAGRSN